MPVAELAQLNPTRPVAEFQVSHAEVMLSDIGVLHSAGLLLIFFVSVSFFRMDVSVLLHIPYNAGPLFGLHVSDMSGTWSSQ